MRFQGKEAEHLQFEGATSREVYSKLNDAAEGRNVLFSDLQVIEDGLITRYLINSYFEKPSSLLLEG